MSTGVNAAARRPFSPEGLKSQAKEKGLTLVRLSTEMGFQKNYLARCGSDGLMSRAAYDLLVLKYGFDPERLAPPPEPEEALETETKLAEEAALASGVNDRNLAALERIAAALEAIATNPAPDAPTLTKLERCTLLVKQMTCYGGCLKSDFEGKAFSHDMGVEIQKTAIQLAGLTEGQKNGETWLSRTRK